MTTTLAHAPSARRPVVYFEAIASEGYWPVKDLIYSNFQVTRATGVPTMVVIDGVSIEMLKRGGAPAPAKAKPKKPRRSAKKASGTKPEQPVKASKPAAARRTEAVPH